MTAASPLAAGLTPAFTSAGAAAGTPSHVNSAIDEVVLGKSGQYQPLAQRLGARYLNLSDEQWSALSADQRWAINQAFLDDAVASGSPIRLAPLQWHGRWNLILLLLNSLSILKIMYF